MTSPALTPRAWFDILFLGAIWGFSFLAVKLALTELPVMTLVAHRVGWAAVALWIWVLWRGLALPRSPKVWAALLVMGVSEQRHPLHADFLGAAIHRNRADGDL